MNASISYSHIIVGGGAAGCVLACRLSENKDFKILLIEAGGKGRFDPTLKVPLMTAILLRGRRRLWNFKTMPEHGLNNRTVDLPRGKVLGGSTSVNGMVYARGLSLDYDFWAQNGMPGWSWESVQPYFLKSEDFQDEEFLENHNIGGELAVSKRVLPVSPLADAFVEAGIAAGHNRVSDFNSPNPEGFGYYHFNIRNGRRESSYTAFLKGVESRQNLTVKTGLEVSRIIFSNNKAVGVEVSKGSKISQIRAEAEVILAGGAIGSPTILLRSGIGPANDLTRIGIKPKLDSPNVGKNLQDHVLVRVSHKTSSSVSLHKLTRIDLASISFLRALVFGTGPMNVFPLEAGAYMRGPGADIPNIQSAFLPALTTATIRFNPFSKLQNSSAGFMANASVMRPLSRGSLQLTGDSLSNKVEIRLNYLSEPQDLETLVDGVELLRDVFSQKPFDPYRGEEIGPGISIKSRSGLREWVKREANTVHHLSGSCRMGVDEESVTDPQLRVRGITGLRVADASIFPSITSANTAAPTIMVAERAVDFISG